MHQGYLNAFSLNSYRVTLSLDQCRGLDQLHPKDPDEPITSADLLLSLNSPANVQNRRNWQKVGSELCAPRNQRSNFRIYQEGHRVKTWRKFIAARRWIWLEPFPSQWRATQELSAGETENPREIKGAKRIKHGLPLTAWRAPEAVQSDGTKITAR